MNLNLFPIIICAQYGKQLYVNYQEAMKRTEAAYDWSSLSTASIRSGSSSASIPGEFSQVCFIITEYRT